MRPLSVPLLLGYGQVDEGSFYLKESLIKPLPALADIAPSVSGFSGRLPELVGEIRRIDVEVLEGEGETGTLEGRGVDTIDIRTGGGMILCMVIHAIPPLLALEKFIGTLPDKAGFSVRTARCQEYMKMAKRRFALPKEFIGESYAEVSCTTAKKVEINVRIGKYIFGDRNRRGVRISGSRGEVYLDWNSCTLFINGKPVLEMNKSYYPVLRAALAQVEGESLFSFNPVDVLARAQELVFDIRRLAYQNEGELYYERGVHPEHIFKIDEPHIPEKLSEEDIRPEDTHNKWLALLDKELPRFFPAHKRVDTACPGCHSTEMESEFVKLGFLYKWCKNSDTISVE